MKFQAKKLRHFINEFILRMRNFLFFSRMKKIKFNIGSGVFNIGKEWYATDIHTLNITNEREWKKLLYSHRIDNIMAEHVWEHLTEEDTILAIRNCYKYLKKKGNLRLAVPDGFHPDKEYIGYVTPGGNGAGADDHKILYNYLTLKKKLEEFGFKVRLLEYWDEQGNFHFTDWTDEGGHITRSKRYDRRNKNGVLNYTSLIVDALK